MAPKMTKKWLLNFLCFFYFLTLFDAFLNPLKAHFFKMSKVKWPFLHFFMFLKSGSKMHPKITKSFKNGAKMTRKVDAFGVAKKVKKCILA